MTKQAHRSFRSFLAMMALALLLYLAGLIIRDVFPHQLHAIWALGVPRALPLVVLFALLIRLSYRRGIVDERRLYATTSTDRQPSSNPNI